MNLLHDPDNPLPPLSDASAVEILHFLEAMYQIFETRYATQIWRYYQRTGIVRTTPSPQNVAPDDDPF